MKTSYLLQKNLLKCFTNLSFTLIVTLFFTLDKSHAQLPFDKKYGSILNNHDAAGSEMVTCASIDANYSYAGVQSIYDPSVQAYVIRGIRIKSDGTIYPLTFDYVIEASHTFNIIPLKIISINGNSEYLITGYVTYRNGIFAAPNRPYPFVIKADADLNATMFKKFDHPGFFSDVDELPGNDLLFSGAQTFLTTIQSYYRTGWIIRTDPTTFTAAWMRSIYTNFTPSSHNYHIVHDAIVTNSDEAIICGSVNEQVNCVPEYSGPPILDSFTSRAFVAKIDLNDGSFIWHSSRLQGYFGARLAINNNGIIAMAVNPEHNTRLLGLAFFDEVTGNWIYGRMAEAADMTTTFNENGNYHSSADINTHTFDITQNIYFKSNNTDIFISGKYINLLVEDGGSIGNFDMPFSMEYNYSSTFFVNARLYKTSQQFSGPVNFLSYDIWNYGNGCNSVFTPFYAASNTLRCNSNCDGNDKFITITMDASQYMGTAKQDKVWIYSNDNYVCGNKDITMTLHFDINPTEHISINNDFIEVSPIVEDLTYGNFDPVHYEHDCIQD